MRPSARARAAASVALATIAVAGTVSVAMLARSDTDRRAHRVSVRSPGALPAAERAAIGFVESQTRPDPSERRTDPLPKELNPAALTMLVNNPAVLGTVQTGNVLVIGVVDETKANPPVPVYSVVTLRKIEDGYRPLDVTTVCDDRGRGIGFAIPGTNGGFLLALGATRDARLRLGQEVDVLAADGRFQAWSDPTLRISRTEVIHLDADKPAKFCASSVRR